MKYLKLLESNFKKGSVVFRSLKLFRENKVHGAVSEVPKSHNILEDINGRQVLLSEKVLVLISSHITEQ